jgi:hypothetical protein
VKTFEQIIGKGKAFSLKTGQLPHIKDTSGSMLLQTLGLP